MSWKNILRSYLSSERFWILFVSATFLCLYFVLFRSLPQRGENRVTWLDHEQVRHKHEVYGDKMAAEKSDTIEPRLSRKRDIIHKGSNIMFCLNLNKSNITMTEEPQSFQKVPNREAFVFSAFYDNRTLVGGPLVRVVTTGIQIAYNKVGDFHCLLWFEGIRTPVNVGPARYQVLYHSTLWPKMYTAHFILCPLKDVLEIPYAVSIGDTQCHKPVNALLILSSSPSSTQRQKPALPYGLGVCISPVYGQFDDTTRIIEFIEMHRLLGARLMTFYDFSIGPSVHNLLNYYTKKGLAQVVKWAFPTEVQQTYFMQRVSLNDCLYRSMGTVKYVAVNDLDEFIVPRSTANWHDMIENIHEEEVGAYLFQHVYFEQSPWHDKHTKHNLLTQSSQNRTEKVYPPGKIRCKSLYECKCAISIDIHFPYELLPGKKEKIVDPKIGMLHHYRKEALGDWKRLLQTANIKMVEDKHMEMYREHLLTAVENIKSKLSLE